MPEEINVDDSLDELLSGCEIIEVSEYCKAVVRGKELPTVVSFSSVNTEPGRFKPFKIVAEATCNIIFVNDNGNNWYINGISGVSDSYAESARIIIDLGRKIGNGKVITLGTSMGAFGALLYAAAGDADACFSFGPEVLLDLPGSRSDQHKVEGAFISCSDIFQVIKDSSTSFYVFTSECDEVDLLNTIALSKLRNVKCVSVRGAEHPGIQVFAEGSGVAAMIDLAFHDPEAVLSFDQRGNILKDEALIKELWIASGIKREKKYKAYLDYLRLNFAEFSYSSLYSYRLAEAFYRNGKQAEAVKLLERAIRLDDLQFEAYNLLGVIQRRNRQYEDAEQNFIASLKISPRNAFAHHNLGLLQMDLGRVKEAVQSFERAVGINRGNSAFAKSLSEAQGKLILA
ncbi:tetratricopeptide repeat protein [Pseudomonas putida]|uniref:tetratricopeptide repeat protein n=1 Tax=Pseudomonas putida TaxID=303 RepID=UPI000EF654E9|nr:tetratricopeptide repeat protein [Pseudomonas putida]AYN12311.1 hypothetical protein CHN49_21615 [Pseudomonas putida]